MINQKLNSRMYLDLVNAIILSSPIVTVLLLVLILLVIRRNNHLNRPYIWTRRASITSTCRQTNDTFKSGSSKCNPRKCTCNHGRCTCNQTKCTCRKCNRILKPIEEFSDLTLENSVATEKVDMVDIARVH